MEALPVVATGINEAREFLQLGDTDSSLHVGHFEVVTKMRIDILVVGAIGQFAQLPVESAAAGVVAAWRTPTITTPVAK